MLFKNEKSKALREREREREREYLRRRFERKKGWRES
jgi:hypothetical protein